MSARRIAFLGIFLASLSLLPSTAAAQGKRFVGYFTEWGIWDSEYYPADVPADKLTHLNYAFIVPADGPDADSYYECTIVDTWAAYNEVMPRLVPGTPAGEEPGTLRQLRYLRTSRKQSHNQTLPILMSLGGAGMGSRFRTLAANATHRQSFVNSCVALLQQEKFDGIDLDWEFPANTTDTANYTALLQAFRTALNGLGNNPRTAAPYLLTSAVSGGKYYLDFIDVANVRNLVDWVNVMTYDYHGCWGVNDAGHNSPLRASAQDPHANFSVDFGIRELLRRGMPASKIHLGLAYFGRGFNNLQNAGPNAAFPGRNGTLDPAVNQPPYCVAGTFGSGDGYFHYWDLADNFVNRNGHARYWDHEQEVPFLYKDLASAWITYDDANSLSTKTHYARNMNLGGVFAWELALESRPAAPKTYPLTSAVADCLND